MTKQTRSNIKTIFENQTKNLERPESKGIAQRLKEVVDAIEIQVVRLEKLM